MLTPSRRWSPLAWACRLRRPGDRRGQAALPFVALMAMILLMSSVTMNVGEVARLKTQTANAADAGALAAASWVASGENEMAQIGRAMLINVMIVQLMFLIPYCFYMKWHPPLVYLLLTLYNRVIMYELTVRPLIGAVWDNAHASALFMALQNLSIDDQSGAVAKDIEGLITQHQENPGSLANDYTFTWDRQGGDGESRPSSVRVQVSFSNGRPDLEMDGWGPWFWWWPFICILCPPFAEPCCCWVPVGYNALLGWDTEVETAAQAAASEGASQAAKAGGEPLWANFVGLLKFPIPLPGVCPQVTCFPLFFGIPGSPTTPGGISNRDGTVTVTVTQRRAGGSQVGFWTMRYPDDITSEATAEYNGPSVNLFSSPNGFAQLVSVR